MYKADSDTIVAPATPPGEGGVAIIRVSGPEAANLLLQTFRPRTNPAFESHRLYYGPLVDPRSGRPIDEVMAVLMRSPRSYTKEDVVEVHCHGGTLLVRQILDLFVDLGARLAQPGEFTLRAFLNGRIDLTQAEAVIDLISARSESAGQVALKQLQGDLYRFVHRLRDSIVDLLAPIEAYIDFPEDDLPPADLDHFLTLGKEVEDSLGRLIESFQTGRTLREGLSILLLGRPNVGKSSLLNALLGEARAIVTEIPGTTRDTLEERFILGSFPLRLIDSAGVRHTDDPIEAEGVRRARDKIGGADLVLLVTDGSRSPDDDDLMAFEACGEARVLLVRNKSDLPLTPLPAPFDTLPCVDVSARTGVGMDFLKQAIVEPFAGGDGERLAEAAIITDRRHREALVRAREGMARFRDAGIQGLSPEFLALELRGALDSLGEITGETTPGEVLDQIFSRFCIGK